MTATKINWLQLEHYIRSTLRQYKEQYEGSLAGMADEPDPQQVVEDIDKILGDITGRGYELEHV